MKQNPYHFVTLCIKYPSFRYKSSIPSVVCTYTNPLTYIKERPITHFEGKTLEVSSYCRIFVQAKI